MKKIFLLGLFALLVLTVWNVYGQQKTVAPQKWQYKSVVIYRQVSSGDNWTHWWENGKELPAPVSMIDKLNELGREGWDLVGIVPVSSSASVGYPTAGFTTQVNYYFKQPLP